MNVNISFTPYQVYLRGKYPPLNAELDDLEKNLCLWQESNPYILPIA
jgi:hypothetical protein